MKTVDNVDTLSRACCQAFAFLLNEEVETEMSVLQYRTLQLQRVEEQSVL